MPGGVKAMQGHQPVEEIAEEDLPLRLGKASSMEAETLCEPDGIPLPGVNAIAEVG